MKTNKIIQMTDIRLNYSPFVIIKNAVQLEYS